MILIKEKIYEYNYGDRILLGEFFINKKSSTEAILEDGRKARLDSIDGKWYINMGEK